MSRWASSWPCIAISGVVAIATREGGVCRVDRRRARRGPRARGPGRRRAGAARPTSSEDVEPGPDLLEERVDRRVAELADERAVRDAGRRALGVHVQPDQRPGRHPVEGVDLGAEAAQQAEDRAASRVAAEHRPVDDDERAAAQRLGDRRQRREVEEAERRRDGVGRLGRPVGPAAQHALGVVAVPDEHAGIRRLDRVEAELEGRDDAEVAAATAQRPEELDVLRRVGAHVLAVGRDELDGGEAVGGEAELAGVPADAAAEAVAGDADVGRAAVQGGEPVVGRRARSRRSRGRRPRRGRSGGSGRC